MAVEVSLAQAGVIAGTEGAVPGSEAELLALARAMDLGRLKDRARKRRLQAIDAEDLHHRRHQARFVRHWRDELGMVRLHAALAPEVGLGLVARLDAETKRLATKARAEERHEPWAGVAGPLDGREGFLKAVLHNGVRIDTVAHFGRHMPGSRARRAGRPGGPV